MRIAVCVKHVPEGPSHLDPATHRLDRSGEGALNHFDANAVEEALRLKGDSGSEVVAVSLGPQKALDSLRKALAMGADRAVLVSDDAAGGSDRVKRQTEFGYDTIETTLPAVVAVSDAINEPRYPSLKGIMGAKKKPQDALSLADLGVGAGEAGEAGSRTTVLALGDPPARGDARKIEDDGNAAQAIVDFLAEKRLV